MMPEGATHVSDTYGIITYWKKSTGILAYGKMMYYNLDNEPYNGWWAHNGKEWQPETCVNSAHFTEIEYED